MSFEGEKKTCLKILNNKVMEKHMSKKSLKIQRGNQNP